MTSLPDAEPWKSTLLPPKALIKDAIFSLSSSSLKIVLIVDSDMNLIGSVTDGDIRRGLARGLTLDSSIAEIWNSKPAVVNENPTKAEVLRIMSENRVDQLPVVDASGKLVGLRTRELIESPIPRENLMVIMAGGKGTRLLPRTQNTPKPMLTIGGKPILEHIINRAKKDGFQNFVLAIHHLGDLIQEYFGNGDSLGVRISYTSESQPLGTAGALSMINPKPSSPILVSNGDIMTDVNYGDILEFHIKYEAMATMAVQIHESQFPFGVVGTHGLEITSYLEKPLERKLINAGIYVLNPEVVNLLTKNTEMHMPALFEMARENKLKTIAYPLHEKWLDLGSPNDLVRAMNDFNSLRSKGGQT